MPNGRTDGFDRVIEVVEIAAADTYRLRRAVLRNGEPDRPVAFAGDDHRGAFHLGVRNPAGDIVATSSWIPNPIAEFPHANAVQLRGMATVTTMQGTGLGGAIFEAGAERCAAAGHDLIWARARDTALAFYVRHGCHVVGVGFIDHVTGVPHHIVARELLAAGCE